MTIALREVNEKLEKSEDTIKRVQAQKRSIQDQLDCLISQLNTSQLKIRDLEIQLQCCQSESAFMKQKLDAIKADRSDKPARQELESLKKDFENLFNLNKDLSLQVNARNEEISLLKSSSKCEIVQQIEGLKSPPQRSHSEPAQITRKHSKTNEATLKVRPQDPISFSYEFLFLGTSRRMRKAGHRKYEIEIFGKFGVCQESCAESHQASGTKGLS